MGPSVCGGFPGDPADKYCPTIIGVQSRSLKTNRKQQPQASEKNGTAVCGPVLRDDFLPAGLTPKSSTCCGWHAFNCANSISTFAFCRQKAMQCYAMFEDVIKAQKQENISKSSMHNCITCKLSSSDVATAFFALSPRAYDMPVQCIVAVLRRMPPGAGNVIRGARALLLSTAMNCRGLNTRIETRLRIPKSC